MKKIDIKSYLTPEEWVEYKKLVIKVKRSSWMTEQTIRFRQLRKKKLIEYAGGKCSQCGYSKDCPRAYHFHHLDPKNKKFGIGSSYWKPMKTLKEEVDKCILLCSRCHDEIHDEEYEKSRKLTIKDHRRKLELAKKAKHEFLKSRGVDPTTKTRECQVCLISFKVTKDGPGQKYCSLSCSCKSKSKIDWSKVDLLAMTKKYNSTEEIARKLNVSGGVVRKRLKRLGYESRKNKSK